MSEYSKQIKINDRKRAAVTAFKDKVWVHFRDEAKFKNVSFSKEDYLNLLEKLDKIQKCIKDCEASIRSCQGSKKQKQKKESHAEMAFAHSSDEE